ncbi:MinD/ParA family protein [Niallia sp. Krafla_26]|uniref:MinD/ParA family protein n=1 Tax=Niallia sp. Krafla_26 TaxID=3064703 RepID=UPI003D16251A
MEDQAQRLRERLKRNHSNMQTKSIAIISGKGGVGKSNMALNFAISLNKKGHSVLLFDMDIGMGNIDILMGLSSSYSIADFFSESVPLKELICKVPDSIHYISGGTGLTQLTQIKKSHFNDFFNQFSTLLDDYEYVILDMGAGMDENSLSFILSVDEVIVLTTPEPTSITDAYAAMKYIILKNNQIPFYLLVNRATSEKEGQVVFNRISTVLEHFLDQKIDLLGIVPEDKSIPQAVKRQTPFILFNNRAPASKAIIKITETYCKQNHLKPEFDLTHKSFISKLKRFLYER